MESLIQGIYREVINLQSLTIEDAAFISPFTNQNVTEHPLLTGSLKKLRIPRWNGDLSVSNLSSRNVYRLLTSVPSLDEVALSFDISSEDLEFFRDHNHPFNTNLSTVNKVALEFKFLEVKGQNGTLRDFWKVREIPKVARGTEALVYLLSLTNKLKCLELNYLYDSEDSPMGGEQDEVFRHASCLEALHRSHHSLKHYRSIGNESFRTVNSKCLLPFDQLTTLTVDERFLFELRFCIVCPPPNLETICVQFYKMNAEGVSRKMFAEEFILAEIVKDLNSKDFRGFARLREIIVPSSSSQVDAEPQDRNEHEHVWALKRNYLEMVIKAISESVNREIKLSYFGNGGGSE